MNVSRLIATTASSSGPCVTTPSGPGPLPDPTGQGFDYGLGVIVIEAASGRIICHDGAIPGFHDVVLSIEDGRRQVGLMTDAFFAPAAVSEAFDQTIAALHMRL